MRSFTPRLYRGHKLDLEEKTSDGYCVKVSSRISTLSTSIGKFDELSTNYLEKYKTPSYETEMEAFTQAYGWVDCDFCNQTDPDENEDPCQKAYNELRSQGTQKEFYEVASASPAKLQQAYKKGWEKKLIDGDAGD